jgi:hypothetical protein
MISCYQRKEARAMGKSVFVNGGAPERAGFPALFIW